MSSILYSVQDGVATITLNRPKVYNSFNREMALACQDALDQAEQDSQVRAIVLTGSGKAFCAGQDLQEVSDPQGPSLTTILQEHYNPIVTRIRAIEKPIIGAVNGVAAGAGANIALACDLTIAAQSASFIQAFSKIGLIPDSGGTYFLPRLIGMQRATALIMLGDKCPAPEAQQMGMIYRCVPNEEFAAAVASLSQTLAQMPTKGLGLSKRALNAGLENNLAQQLVLEDQLQTAASQTYDYKEGVQAFLEKRKPAFKGK